MKRSEINNAIASARKALVQQGIRLPPFSEWSVRRLLSDHENTREIRECRLGWDVTDFGSNDFARTGLTLFTCRNGHPDNPRYGGTTYCEKVLIAGEGQRTPMHYHRRKQEDIICRAGGNLICDVYNVAADRTLADTEVRLSRDGVQQRVPAGYRFTLHPGESVRLPPLVYHEFQPEAGTGLVILGEVSGVNDDLRDNFFLSDWVRFSEIEEDEPPQTVLCSEYG